MRIRMSKGETAYDAVSKIIKSKYGDRGESIVVQLRQKCNDNEPWEELTVLYLNEGNDWRNRPYYVWEIDWWEGQEIVELIAAATVSDIKLDYDTDFLFIWEDDEKFQRGLEYGDQDTLMPAT